MSVPITQVLVHPDGALVTRSGAASVHDGWVRVDGLPLLLDASTVRVRVEAPASWVAQRLELAIPAPVAPASDGSAEALAVCEATLAGLRRERDVLAGLAPTSAKDAGPAGWRAWMTAERAIEERVAALDASITAAERERDTLLTAPRAARADRWAGWAPARGLAVQVACEAAEVQLTVSYRVPGARWSPGYVLEADAALQTGRFVLRALIAQVTGEDWTDAAIALTSRPSGRRADIPDPPLWRLAREAADPAPDWRALPADLDTLFPEDLSPPSPDPGGLAAHLRGSNSHPPTAQSEQIPRTLNPSRNRTPPGAFSDLVPRPIRTPTPVSAPERVQSAVAVLAPPTPAPVAVPAAALAGSPGDEWLDHALLRMSGFAEARERRGRLYRADDEVLLTEADAPHPARRRFAEAMRDREAAAAALIRRPLPEHHVLPSPTGWGPRAQRGAEVRHDVVGRASVPSDGLVHATIVASWPVDLEITYRAIPRSDLRVHRRAKAVVRYDRPLLGGPVQVQVDGKTEGVEPWNGSDGASELLVAFGPEERLVLTRSLSYREEELPDGGQRTYTSTEVTLTSQLPRAVVVDLLERIPVAHPDADVRIEVTEAYPASLPHTGDANGPILKGGRIQQVALEPHGQARAVFGYALTTGSETDLVGGVRRG